MHEDLPIRNTRGPPMCNGKTQARGDGCDKIYEAHVSLTIPMTSGKTNPRKCMFHLPLKNWPLHINDESQVVNSHAAIISLASLF